MRDIADTIKDMTSTMKECLRLIDNGYLTTVAVKIKELALRLDDDGIGTQIATLKSEGLWHADNAKIQG